MATVIDITNKIKNEEAFVKIKDASYKVDKSKNNMIKVMALLDQMENENDIEVIDKALELMIGKKEVKEIDKLNLSIGAYVTLFHAVIACAMDMSLEEAEKRFQG